MSLPSAYFVGVALLIAIIPGYALCVLLLPRRFSPHLVWALGPAVGLGICSLIYVVFRRPMFTVEITLAIAGSVFLYRRFRAGKLFGETPAALVLSLFMLGTLVLALPFMLTKIDRVPHGNWDGWAIWNTHARLLFRMGPDWKNQTQYTFHGDYPVLTPSLTARFWRYIGHEVPKAGGFTGLILGLSGIAVLTAALSELRDKRLAIVMSLVLLGTPNYMEHSTSQYADVPISFYILATLALICLHSLREAKEKSILVLAGFTAGCAGWTKNEGLLFVAALSVAMLTPVVFRRAKVSERFAPFLAGLMAPLAVIIAFKLTVPAYNDLVANQGYDVTFQRITDPSRYVLILTHFFTKFRTLGAWPITPIIPILLLVAIRGLDRKILKNPGCRVAFLTLALVLAGYFVVYVNTPIDLQVHLDSSLDRLAMHLWPAFLLLLGLSAKQSLIRDHADEDHGAHYSKVE